MPHGSSAGDAVAGDSRSVHDTAIPDQRTSHPTTEPRPRNPQETSPRAGLKRFHRVVWSAIALDAVVILAACVLAWPLRGLVPHVPPATEDGVTLAAKFSPLFLGIWVACLGVSGAYAKGAFGAGPEEFQRVVTGSAVAAFATSTTCYFLNTPLARGFLACAFIMGGPALFAERYLLRRWIQRRRLDGTLTRRVLAVGSRGAIASLVGVLDRERHLGYEVVGCTLTDPARSSAPELPAPSVGSVEEIREICSRLDIDTVMVAGGADVHLRDITWELEGRDVELVVVPHLVDIAGGRLQMRPVAGLPLLHVEEPQAERAGGRSKRIFDVVAAFVGLLLLAPLMLTFAVLIKLSDGGPIFYKQRRVGLNGKAFDCWKFRSMSVNAEAIEAKLRAESGHEGVLWKMENDPRITRVGRFIRRYSIDEVPQLFNVLNGTMSLVGPRPQQQWEVDTYDDVARRRLHVRPGMTGLWQVSGRSRLTWQDALRLDLYYRDNWSMVGDFLIIGKTIRAVVGKDGAY